MSRCFDGCLGQLIHRKIKMMNIYKTIRASKIMELILAFFLLRIIKKNCAAIYQERVSGLWNRNEIYVLHYEDATTARHD